MDVEGNSYGAGKIVRVCEIGKEQCMKWGRTGF
jgi:hypothetical protein